MAFSAKPDQLELSLPTDKTVVYGIIMDWEMSGAVATTVSYQTGDASLYLSSGGGVMLPQLAMTEVNGQRLMPEMFFHNSYNCTANRCNLP